MAPKPARGRAHRRLQRAAKARPKRRARRLPQRVATRRREPPATHVTSGRHGALGAEHEPAEKVARFITPAAPDVSCQHAQALRPTACKRPRAGASLAHRFAHRSRPQFGWWQQTGTYGGGQSCHANASVHVPSHGPCSGLFLFVMMMTMMVMMMMSGCIARNHLPNLCEHRLGVGPGPTQQMHAHDVRYLRFSRRSH